jgi:hypothetical protein
VGPLVPGQRYYVLVLATLVPAAELGPTRVARLDAWRVIGPGGGGTMRRPAISPHASEVVLLGCDMTGAYVTVDGGASWRIINFGSVPTAFAFDPSRAGDRLRRRRGRHRSARTRAGRGAVLPTGKRTVAARSATTEIACSSPRTRRGREAAERDDPRDRGRRGGLAQGLRGRSAADSPVPGTPASPTVLLGSTDGAAPGPGSRLSPRSGSSRCMPAARPPSSRDRRNRRLCATSDA